MAFKDIFKDSNDINEKSVVGFASFAMMCIFAVAGYNYWRIWQRNNNTRLHL